MDSDAPEGGELARLRAAAIRILRDGRPATPPLPFLLGPLLQWFEECHIAQMRSGAFPDARRAFNPVFIHLPADGCRLTALAQRAGMTKQAMAELVDELVDLGYLVRFPDPQDGRAKIILRSAKGLRAHETTMRAFEEIERALAGRVGHDTLAALRTHLATALEAISATGTEDGRAASPPSGEPAPRSR